MSMSNENLHTVVDTASLIAARSLVYFQQWTTGVNLTYFHCHGTVPTISCLPPKPDNEIRLLGNVRHTEYVAIGEASLPESPSTSCYYSSLIVPIFQALAQYRVANLSLHLFVSSDVSTDVEQLAAIERNLSTSIDRVPFLYEYESSWDGVRCAPPLYLINQLQILTALTVEPTAVEDIFRAFSLAIWFTILVFYLLVVGLDVLLLRSDERGGGDHLHQNRNQKLSLGDRLWRSSINYFKVLLAKETASSTFNRRLFLFWALGCLPLVEIFRNDMIAKIVESKFRSVDSIEELLDQTKLTGLALSGDLSLWKDPNFVSMAAIQYEEVRQRYQRLFARTEAMAFDDPKWLELMNSPRQLIEVLHTSAILEDEFAIRFFERLLVQILPVHLSRESYFPQYVSPICYIQTFPYRVQLEKLTRELYETGLLFHWDTLKHDYYSAFGKRIFKLLAGDDVLDRINVELDSAGHQQQMSNLFGYFLTLYAVLTIVNVVVFIGEMAYYFQFDRQLSKKNLKGVEKTSVNKFEGRENGKKEESLYCRPSAQSSLSY